MAELTVITADDVLAGVNQSNADYEKQTLIAQETGIFIQYTTIKDEIIISGGAVDVLRVMGYITSKGISLVIKESGCMDTDRAAVIFKESC